MKYILCALLFVVTHSANAQLFSRAGGTMVYDSDYDVTWLADANYAFSSSYIPSGDSPYWGTPPDANWDGRFTFDQAVEWAENLVFGGIGDWRLPSAYKTDGSAPINWETGSDSELAHMSDLVNTNPTTNLFFNIQSTMYWSGIESSADPTRAWMTTFSGSEPVGAYYVYEQWKDVGSTYAWAVADGDIGAVPLPLASWLFAPALAWLFSITRPLRTRES